MEKVFQMKGRKVGELSVAFFSIDMKQETEASVEDETSTVSHGIWDQLLVNKWTDEHLMA